MKMANKIPKQVQEFGRIGGLGAGLVGIGFGVYAIYKTCFYTVQPGHRAVIFSRLSGVSPNVKQEGLHFRIPWLIYPVDYNIRARPKKIISPTGSKDLQIVNIGLRVLYRPDPLNLPTIYRFLGPDFDERVLPSITNEILKAVVAQFNASQLITQRSKVSLLVREQLMERARDFNILLDDVSITDLSFSSEYTSAVEAKQVAQQEAQRAQFLVERAIQQKQEKIVKAEGEAQAATLIGLALKTNPGYLKLRKIQAAQNIASTIAHSQNRVYLNADTLMLNLKDMEVTPTRAGR